MFGYNFFAIANESDTIDQFPGSGDLFDAVYVGGAMAGDVAVVRADNVEVVFEDVQPGTLLPVSGRRIGATNTTATNVVVLCKR